MKIIDIRTSSGIHGNTIGGGAVYFNEILLYLSSLKSYNITVIKSQDDSSHFPNEIEKLTLNFSSNRDAGDLKYFLTSLFGFLFLLHGIRKFNFKNLNVQKTVVISESPAPSDILSTAHICRNNGYKGIIYFHHIPPPFWVKPFRRGVFKSIAKSFLTDISLSLVKIFNLAIAIDNYNIMQYSHFNFHGQIFESPSFFPQNYILNQSFNIKDKDEIEYDACYVGRIEEGKGLKDLIRCWDYVLKALPSAKIVIIGNLKTKFGEKVLKLIKKKKLDENIILTGFISDAEKRRFMKRSKLFVFPSYEEGWSIALMESIILGLVPVLYNLPAYDYLSNFPYKVKIGDYINLGKTIVKLLQLDEEELNSLNKNLKSQILKFTLQYSASQQIINFKRLLGE